MDEVKSHIEGAGIHADIVEAVIEDAARDGTASVAAVPDGDVVEIDSGIVDVEGAADVIGDIGERNPKETVLEHHVFARDFQRLGRTVRADLPGQLSAHLAEDVGEEGGCIAEVEALESGVEPECLVLGNVIPSCIHHGSSLEGTAQGVVEETVFKVPRTTEGDRTRRASGDEGGVCGNVDHQPELFLDRRCDHGSSVCYTLDTQIIGRDDVRYSKVDVVDADHQCIGLVAGYAAVHREVLVPVGYVQPDHADGAVGVVVGCGIETPLFASEIDVRSQAPGVDHGLARSTPGEVAGEIEFAAVFRAGHVVVVVAQADVVVVGIEHQGVVLHPYRGREGEFGAGDCAVKGIIGIIEIQVDALDVFVLVGKAGRRDVAGEPSSFGDAHPYGRTVGDVGSRGEERKEVAAVMEVEGDAIGSAAPFTGRFPEQRPDLFPGRDVLDVPGDVSDASGTIVCAVEEVRSQLDTVVLSAGGGRDVQVTDVVHAVGALELKVLGVDTPDEVSLSDTLEIGVEAAQGHPGNIPFVDVECVQVGISEIGGEPVQGVLRGAGKCRKALEHETKVGVVADDAAVERVVRELSGRVYAGVVVAKEIEPVNAKRIDVDGRVALAEIGSDRGLERYLMDEILADQPAYVEIVGSESAVDPDGFVADYVLDVEVGPGGTGRRVQGAVDLKVGQGAGSTAVENESLAACKPREIEGLAGYLLAEEASKTLGSECKVLELAVQTHLRDVVES